MLVSDAADPRGRRLHDAPVIDAAGLSSRLPGHTYVGRGAAARSPPQLDRDLGVGWRTFAPNGPWPAKRALRRLHEAARPCGEDNGRWSLHVATPLSPPHLQRRPGCLAIDGGLRTCAPEETLRRFGHHAGPGGVAEALRRLEVSGGTGPINVYATTISDTRAPHAGGMRSADGRLLAFGKGVSDAQARASALCEALERYSGFYRGTEPVRRASYVELGSDAVHPPAFLHFSERQYANLESLNAQPAPVDPVPLPFDEAAIIDWSAVWSLSEERWKYLPAAYCYYGYPSSPDSAYCRANSNGNAAGNTPEEAVLQGALELVERDAVAIWWYNRVPRPGVDIASFGEPYFEATRAMLGACGREFWLLDVTGDLGIPVFVAVSRKTDGAEGDLVLGCGAHLDARLAALRAVTELNQTIALLEDESFESGEAAGDDEMDWVRTATIANQPYLAPSPALSPCRVADFAALASTDLLDAMTDVRGRIERLGLEMLVLDQTRPEIGLPVVKVVVPGLRHWYPRFGPGRLYDVPVKLGWLAAPLMEDALNPVPFYL